ncbi:MarR family winged helix-turn-helix transcriptional regulator [Arthrobacter woluwensis]|uniref:MarR family winged helix-turn-helix transcriptional regulator n=1 Tax=Arthrobacter woluwensis TaxID=156980 RepID=UPI001AAF0DB6|nr:MarR family transcriptional regulator [Arthrobacter woluwensis]QTF73007.1 MarR family transcriptional regulator [Arthrobacter woluwensis]
MNTPPDLQDLASELRVALMRTSRVLRSQASSDAVTPGQNTVLALLHKHGPQTMGQLAEAEHVQAPSMTRTVNALADKGLIRREARPEDGRQVLISLTSEGNAVLEESRRLRSAWLAERLESLGERERETLHDAALLLLDMTRTDPRRSPVTA